MAKIKPRTEFHYEVSGVGRFPLDMLRYDRCWPSRSEDVSRIEASIHSLGEWNQTERTVRLTSHHAPTSGRWESFQWSVWQVG